MEPLHAVVHVTPEGDSRPVRNDQGQLLLFGDVADAESFARGLIEAGLPDALLANLRDIDALSGPGPGSDVATVFDDGVRELSSEERREAARQLALTLAPSLRLS
jgi:hypothetical protein